MFLSILPDVDIIFRLAGIELGHRTFTHSAIIWLVFGGIVASYFATKYERRGQQAAVYLIAYLSHIMIGDIIAGPINVLYPVGNFMINSPIKGVQQFFLETILFASMASVVIAKYYTFKERKEDIFLFGYHYKIDTVVYPCLILALLVSYFYILAKFDLSFVEASIITPLHFAAICIITLIWKVSKSSKTQRRLVFGP